MINLIKHIATIKKLFSSLSLGSDLPEYAIGDEKQLMQTILNVVGNAVKFSKEDNILISAILGNSDSLRDPRAPNNYTMHVDTKHFYLHVQVGFLLVVYRGSMPLIISVIYPLVSLIVGKRFRIRN